jgi:hypothetical membrane protein
MESKRKPESRREKSIHKIFAWTGIVAFPYFFVLLTIAGLLTPNYSPISQHGSDLGVGPYAWLFNSGLTIYGILLIIFSVGFYYAIGSLFTKRRLFAATILLVLSGVGGVIAGVFSEAYPDVHAFGGLLIFGFPSVAQIISGSKLRNIPAWQTFGRYTYLSGIGTLALDFFSTFYPILKFVSSTVFLVNALDNQFAGLLQRIEMITTWGWFTVSGVKMLRMQNVRGFEKAHIRENVESATQSSKH